MDLIDMRSDPSKDGYKWIFHAMDHFTKLHILEPLFTKDAESVAKCLTGKIFPIFGLPKILQTDNGKEFVNKIIHGCIENWPGKCVIINGRPRHPQSQGLVEQERYCSKYVKSKKT